MGMYTDGMSAPKPLLAVANSISIDYDFKNKMLYWSDVSLDAILRAHIQDDYTLGNPEKILDEHIENVDGISVDWIHGNIYWTDNNLREIGVAMLNGSMRTTLVKTDLDEPRGIAVDPNDGLLFCSDWGKQPKIERMSLDGDPTFRKTIVSDQTQWPNGVALDLHAKRVYWTDAKFEWISSILYDGTGRRIVHEKSLKIDHPFSIAIYEDNVYWSDWKSYSVNFANKMTGEDLKTIYNGPNTPYGVTVYHSLVQIQGSKRCVHQNGNSSQLCLPRPLEIYRSNEDPSSEYVITVRAFNSYGIGQPIYKTATTSAEALPQKPEVTSASLGKLKAIVAFKNKVIKQDTLPGYYDRPTFQQRQNLLLVGPNMFRCDNDSKCKDNSWKCDGDFDCIDHSDEMNCTTANVTHRCRGTEWECKSGEQCIHGSWKCDGEADCPDGSDEENCTFTCKPDQFQCAGKSCIHASLRCDGSLDCTDGSDETNCNNPCNMNNGGCVHTCIPLPNQKHRCECLPGFRLVGNSSCEDIDECLEDKHVCERPSLIFANRHDIRELKLDSMQVARMVEGSRSAISVDYDFKNKMMYWSDSSTLRRAPISYNITPEMQETIVSDDIKVPDGIAVDWIYGNIYWTDTGVNRIEVSKQDGTMRKTLIDSDIDEPRAIAVDPNEGQDNHLLSQIWYLDYLEKRVYWVDAKVHKVSSVDYDGKRLRNILQNDNQVQSPFAIAVFEDDIFWTDWASNSIKTINKISGKDYRQLATGISSPMDIHVYHEKVQISGMNHCGQYNGQCSHLCLPIPTVNAKGKRYSCACPNGFDLGGDGFKCIQVGK
ncbi:hypothetical protein FSP39_017308 [Pinctada imbricata]|uniref:EGF-like domain-containing protein n=1 Tax=Pinctada imbricata TaxID=66713 RepID=A0AA88Y1U7_PINIB|nr:hypothetical protein FSP39_017308 [Pinctada imbricata]